MNDEFYMERFIFRIAVMSLLIDVLVFKSHLSSKQAQIHIYTQVKPIVGNLTLNFMEFNMEKKNQVTQFLSL